MLLNDYVALTIWKNDTQERERKLELARLANGGETTRGGVFRLPATLLVAAILFQMKQP